MKDPTPVEIATVAAPIYAAMNPARASMADAVNAARKLIEEAAKPAALVMTNRLLDSEKAAKQIGFKYRETGEINFGNSVCASGRELLLLLGDLASHIEMAPISSTLTTREVGMKTR